MQRLSCGRLRHMVVGRRLIGMDSVRLYNSDRNPAYAAFKLAQAVNCSIGVQTCTRSKYILTRCAASGIFMPARQACVS